MGTRNEKKDIVDLRKSVPIARTRNQKRVLDYLQQKCPCITNYDSLSSDIGVPVGSVRKVISKFEKEGVLSKYQVSRGIEISLIGDNTGTQSGHSTRARESGTQFTIDREIDDKKSNLSISEILKIKSSDFKGRFPALTNCGFGMKELRLVVCRIDSETPLEMLSEGLTHLEWELSNNGIKDRKGRAVGAGYLVNALIQNQGYWDRPADFLSVEERRERDILKEQQRQLDLTLKTAEQLMAINKAKFAVWYAVLTPVEIDAFKEQYLAFRRQSEPNLTGSILQFLGSEDVWLFPIWEQIGRPELDPERLKSIDIGE